MSDDPIPNIPIPFPDRGAKCDADRARLLAAEVERQRIYRDARRIVDTEQLPAVATPEMLTVRELLARPEEAVEWRIEALQPVGCRVVFAAPPKTGKTTVVGAVARSAVDGVPLFGR